MSEEKKLEYIHHVLQETGNGYVDLEMVEQAIEYTEEIREKLNYCNLVYLTKNSQEN
tara:strand:+ start:352 stop:522 length:171 start_codon:yes stop_codon:yes gene_type:complete